MHYVEQLAIEILGRALKSGQDIYTEAFPHDPHNCPKGMEPVDWCSPERLINEIDIIAHHLGVNFIGEYAHNEILVAKAPDDVELPYNKMIPMIEEKYGRCYSVFRTLEEHSKEHCDMYDQAFGIK